MKLDRRIADLEKTAPPAKRRPTHMTSEEFLDYVTEDIGEVPEEVAIAEFRAWVQVMTVNDLLVTEAALKRVMDQRRTASAQAEPGIADPAGGSRRRLA